MVLSSCARASLWAVLSAALSACTPVYYVVRSTPVVEEGERPRPGAEPRPHPDRIRIALLPWEGCAREGAAEACARALASLEEAMLERGFQVVAWQALRDREERHDQTAAEAAQTLQIPYLVRVQAPQLFRTRPLVHFRRAY